MNPGEFGVLGHAGLIGDQVSSRRSGFLCDLVTPRRGVDVIL